MCFNYLYTIYFGSNQRKNRLKNHYNHKINYLEKKIDPLEDGFLDNLRRKVVLDNQIKIYKARIEILED